MRKRIKTDNRKEAKIGNYDSSDNLNNQKRKYEKQRTRKLNDGKIKCKTRKKKQKK